MHLVVTDAPHIEISRLGVRQIKTADAGRGCHGHALGERHANVLALQQLKHLLLHAVVGARWVTGCRPDALVVFFDQFFIAQVFSGCVAPQVTAHPGMHALGKGFGQAVGQGLEHDGAVVVVVIEEVFFFGVHPNTRGDREQTHMVCALADGCDKVREATVRVVHTFTQRFFGLLAQAVPSEGFLAA